jgi:DNA-binding CsgD family transcriptional regulator
VVDYEPFPTNGDAAAYRAAGALEPQVELRGIRAAGQQATGVSSGLTGHDADIILAWQRLERRSARIQQLLSRLGHELSASATECAALRAAFREAARPHDGAIALAQLSPQQLRVLGLAAQGRTYHEIAEELHLSRETVKSYLREARGKLAIPSRARRSPPGGTPIGGVVRSAGTNHPPWGGLALVSPRYCPPAAR